MSKSIRWGRYIRRLVEAEFGDNQSVLARAIGTTPQTVSRWAHGGSVPDYPVLAAIAKAAARPLAEVLAAAHGTSPAAAAKLEEHAAEVAATLPTNKDLDEALAALDAALVNGNISKRAWRSAHNAVALAARMQVFEHLGPDTRRDPAGAP